MADILTAAEKAWLEATATELCSYAEPTVTILVYELAKSKLQLVLLKGMEHVLRNHCRTIADANDLHELACATAKLEKPNGQ